MLGAIAAVCGWDVPCAIAGARPAASDKSYSLELRSSNPPRDSKIDTARARELARQLAAGLVAGITGVIFAMTFGALLFAGPLERFLGHGLTIALIALAVGSLVGWASREKALIAGADSNSTSLLASALAGLGAAGLAPDDTLQVALRSEEHTSEL